MKPEYILLGDYSRYTCLSNLIGRDIFNLKNYSIWISYGKDFSIALKDKCYYVTTYKIIPNMTIFIPKDDYDLKKIPIDIECKCIIFEEFPFLKVSTEKIIKNLNLSNKGLVLVNSNLFVASTDLNKKGEDFEAAKRHYLLRNIKLICVDNVRDIKQIETIFHWKNSLKDYYLNRAQMYLKELKEDIQNIKYDYELILEDWNIDDGCLRDKKKICSYETIKEYKRNSIWHIYMLEGYNKLFPSSKIGGIYDVLTLYKDIMKVNPLVVWDLKRDQEILFNRLVYIYRASLDDMYYKKYNSMKFLENEIAYLRCISNSKSLLYGINIKFLKKFDRYVNEEILCELEDFLNNKYNNLEKILFSRR